MYIPIGPSKKQLYKIIIALLLLFYLIFLGMYKPKAQVTSSYGFNETSNTYGVILVQMSGKSQTVNFERTIFRNSGNGNVVFNLNMAGLGSSTAVPLAAVRIRGQVADYECQMGSGFWYYDNGTQRIILPVTCPFNSDYGNGMVGLELIRESTTGSLGVYVPTMYTFVYGDNFSQQTSDLTSAINSAATAIINSGGTNTTAITSAISAQTQAIVNAIQNNSTAITNIQNNTQNISDSINDSSIDSSSATDFKSNSAFQDSNGLDAIIKAPLNFIRSLTSSTCSAINLTIPFINADVSLPCMSTIYNKALGQQLVNLIALVINGVVLYRYCLKILQLVHNAKNPNKDELEVLDL